MLDVVEVVLKFFLGFGEGGAVSIADLGPPCESRTNERAQVIERQLFGEPGDEFGSLRPGADEAHVAAQNVPQLRYLIDAALAQKHADPGDSRIVLGGPLGATGFGVGEHGAELDHLEIASAHPYPGLAKKDRPLRRELNRQHHQREERQEQQEPEPSDADGYHLAGELLGGADTKALAVKEV